MTENEIIKALECCKEREFKTCRNCPLLNINGRAYEMSKNALDLINRQKSKIERLENLSKHHQTLINMLNNGIAEARAEAVKDLLIRLTMHFATYRAEDEIKIKDMFQIIQKFAEETVDDNK